MKKIICSILSIILIAFSLVGCTNTSPQNLETNNKIKIVTTIFPEYDWVREIVGLNNANIELTLLQKNGTDLHSFEPSAKDMVAIADADIFIYVGGNSDIWINDALKNSTNPNQVIINLFDVLKDTLKPLVITKGMEHHHDENGEHIHDNVNDEHVWLSLNRASIAIKYIAEQIINLDPDNSDTYISNLNNYLNKIEELNQEYKDVIASSSKDTLLFGDRFPFFYLCDDYNINYYAAFSGCSAESEASFETVATLAKKVDELGLKNIITIENRTHKIPETIIENTKLKDQNILEMNSLQSITDKQIKDGITYLNVMQSNLDILKKALN